MPHLLARCLLLLCAGGLLCGATVRLPGGRIASSHDGNSHDKDDYGASAMVIALVARAGLADRLVHFQYNNNLDQDNDSREAIMRESAVGAAQRFGVSTSRLFDCQTQLAQAIEHFRTEGNKSTASDPLWYICAGPMEIPWRCISAVDPARRTYIHVISHSPWNEGFTSPPAMTHDWADIGALGVTRFRISGQNKGIWYTGESSWSWLKNNSDPDLRWLYSRDQITDKFDVSDSGMAFWLLTGGPDGGVDTGAQMADVRAILEGGSQPATFSVSAGADRTVALSGGSATLTLDGTLGNVPAGTTASVTWSQVSGPAATIASPGSLDTTASVGATGTYVFQLAATAGTAADSDTVQFTVTTGTTTNLRPVVDAGPDATVTLVGGVATFALDATVTDDGLPNGTLTTKWTRPSGPAAVTFAAATAIDTTVTFTVAGEYKLKLAANDGALIGTDTLLVTVTAGGTGGGEPAPMAVTGFTLINADTDQPVAGYDPIPAGAVIDTTAIGTANLTLVATTTGAVASVVFGVDDVPNHRLEGAAPWSLAGDSGGDYKPWSLGAGEHTVTATPWSGKGGAGSAGSPGSITFTLVTSPTASG